jgi:glutaredoxin
MKKALFIALLLPLLVFAQDSGKKKAYYFYGEQCPHCHKVDEYFKASGAYDKYEIVKLEATSNPFNGKLFLEFGKAFGVADWGGVPTVIFGDKYIVGDQPIIDDFVREIDAAENAYELPDPSKIQKESDMAEQDSQPDQNISQENDVQQAEQDQKGNKNKYFPVIIFALVLVGGGALVYINRKKSRE